MNHDDINRIMGPAAGKGIGIEPNPFALKQAEWVRRKQYAAIRAELTRKIESLFEPRFITPPETSEAIEALITLTDSRRILEVGTYSGFTTLHMVRAVYGKPGAKVVSIDARPAHDREYWLSEDFKNVVEFVEGWTPQVLDSLSEPFDFVFVDSDHSVEHTTQELAGLWRITRPGTVVCFHDVPAWQTPDNKIPPPVREWLLRHAELEGLCLHSCEQLDCLDAWGAGYPRECNPGLGIFVRK